MDKHELERARPTWRYRGTERPAFAVVPSPGQESVWDYPRPPRLHPDARCLRIVCEGSVVADTMGAYRILETAPSKVECYVDDDRVLLQPGGFYGGWVADEVVGPFKGEPGTGGW